MAKERPMREYAIERIPHRVWGRTGKSHSPLALFWSGSALEIRLRATEAWIELETDYNSHEVWIAVVLDDTVTQRLMLPKGRSRICLFRAMERESAHSVRIVRDTPAMAGDSDPANLLLLRSVTTDGEFDPVLERRMKIEFIGDSITSGEGCAGPRRQMEWNSGCFSAVNSYPFYVSQELGAEYSVISQSGWGVAFSYQGSREEAIPLYYDAVCGLLTGDRARRMGALDLWDFTSWQPDVILVNLGTNDASAIADAGFNARKNRMEREFRQAIVEFLFQLRDRNPRAQIIWAYGMLNDDVSDLIHDAMDEYYARTRDERVTFFLQGEMLDGDIGSREHPGPSAHQKAAADICDLLEDL